MNLDGKHSAHCLRYGQAPRGRRSGASGWPSAPAPKRAGGVATGGARRSERLMGNCRARAPRPGNVGVAVRASDRPDDWKMPPWHHREGRESSQVENHLLLGKQVVAARHLRQTRKPRPHKRPIIPTVNPLLEFLAKRWPFRTRSD